MSKKATITPPISSEFDLDASDLLQRNTIAVEIPGRKNGQTGYAWVCELAADDVMRITGQNKATTKSAEGVDVADTNNRDWLYELVEAATVKRDGSPMFPTAGVLRRAPMNIFKVLSEAALEVNALNVKDEEGSEEDPSVAEDQGTSSATSTDSPSTSESGMSQVG